MYNSRKLNSCVTYHLRESSQGLGDILDIGPELCPERFGYKITLGLTLFMWAFLLGLGGSDCYGPHDKRTILEDFKNPLNYFCSIKKPKKHVFFF